MFTVHVPGRPPYIYFYCKGDVKVGQEALPRARAVQVPTGRLYPSHTAEQLKGPAYFYMPLHKTVVFYYILFHNHTYIHDGQFHQKLPQSRKIQFLFFLLISVS